ncbi:MAG: hypothetical protein AAF585_05500, partial [Verrucomicrobiota bacterium]
MSSTNRDLQPLVWVGEDELPDKWRAVLDPDNEPRELGVVPVLKVESPGLWGFIGFLFFGVMFMGGVAMFIHQIRGFSAMAAADRIMGFVMSIFMVAWLPWFVWFWLRMLS